MNVRPNINRRDLDKFVDSIWRADAELYIWAELWPTWRTWYEQPDCHIDGCLICGDDWVWDRGTP